MDEKQNADFGLTEDQRKYLNSLVCQRISDDKNNKECIRHFVNRQNPGIAASLIHGWNADKKDKLAYYIVKDPEMKVPLLFFSVKCGEITVPYDLERKKEILKNAKMLYAAATGHKSEEWAQEVIRKMKESGLSPKEIEKHFEKRYTNNLSRINLHAQESMVEGDNIVRVSKTYPAVELVHFCAFDPVGKVDFPPSFTREEKQRYLAQYNPVLRQWLAKGMGGRSLGETLFWECVVPVIRNIRSLVGCEYIYLFAADNAQFGSLVRYYEGLGFEFREDLYVNKPEYDYTCFFMCQEVTALRNRKNAFLKNYNRK